MLKVKLELEGYLVMGDWRNMRNEKRQSFKKSIESLLSDTLKEEGTKTSRKVTESLKAKDCEKNSKYSTHSTYIQQQLNNEYPLWK